MLSRFNRFWRLLATAFSFTAFGLGGLLLRLVWFPLIAIFIPDHDRRARMARGTIHYAFRTFIEMMRLLGVLSYRISGLEKLQRPGLLVLANHPTLIDVVFLISLMPNADCVVKASLRRNPFTRGPVNATGYVCNDSGVDLIDDCIHSIHSGNNLIIFPEGTRTPLEGEMKLQRGAANIAVRGQIDITPVIIGINERSLAKGMPWWHIPKQKMHFAIEIRDDLPVAQFEQAGGEAMAARNLTQFLHQYFSRETPIHVNT